jgi:hypothetical protein
MRLIDELEIKDAVWNGDEQQLRRTLSAMPFADFEEVQRVVRSVPGGWQYDQGDRIRLGGTEVQRQGNGLDVR